MQASTGVGDALMAPAMERSLSGFGITATMLGLGLPFLIAIPIVLWVGSLNRRRALSAPRSRFRMKNVLGTTYLLRVFISLGFLLLPKTVPIAFIMTALLGATGDSTVPPTMGTITRKFGAKRIGVLYGFALVGHQIGAFASASLGGLFVKNGMGYGPLWVVNLCLAALAAGASYAIREEKHGRG